MAWTAKPNGTITLKSTGLASSITKAWTIDDGSGLTWSEYVSGTDDIVWPSSAVTWNSNPTTADVGQYVATTGMGNVNRNAGTIVFIFTPSNWTYSSANIVLFRRELGGDTIKVEYLQFTNSKIWQAQVRFNYGTVIDVDPDTDFTSDAQLNTHTVVVLAWENNVAPSTDNGIRMVVKRKDIPTTSSATGGATGNGTGGSISVPDLDWDNGGVSGESIEAEGVFYWNTRLSDADMDTLADDPWGTLADTGSGQTVLPKMNYYRQRRN